MKWWRKWGEGKRKPHDTQSHIRTPIPVHFHSALKSLAEQITEWIIKSRYLCSFIRNHYYHSIEPVHMYTCVAVWYSGSLHRMYLLFARVVSIRSFIGPWPILLEFSASAHLPLCCASFYSSSDSDLGACATFAVGRCLIFFASFFFL